VTATAMGGDPDDTESWPPPRARISRTTIAVLSLHNLPKKRERRPRYDGSREASHSFHPELSGTTAPPDNSPDPSLPGLVFSLHAIGGFHLISNTLPLPAIGETRVAISPRDNGMNATFGGEEVHCVAAEPNAVFLRLGVMDGRQEVACDTVVLGRLRPGYRTLQLRSSLGTRIELAYLLVHVSFSRETHIWATPKQQVKTLQEQSEAVLLLQKRMQGMEGAVDDPDDVFLPSDVHAFDGFEETASRIIFPYSDTMAHLADEPPPQHVTILASGEVASEPKPILLGGTWKASDLKGKSDKQLQQLCRAHGVRLTQTGAREAVYAALVGKERDLTLCDAALMTFPMAQSMPIVAAKEHLTKSPNSNFVWSRTDGSTAVVHCWPIKYNATFRAAFDVFDHNPDSDVFAAGKVSEFRQAMRRLFGSAADRVPLLYVRKTTHNPSLVLIGGRESLIGFLRARPDVMRAMNILVLLSDGFRTAITIRGANTSTKKITLPEAGTSVIYVKTGYEVMAISKSFSLFAAECELGRPLVLRSDLLKKLSTERA